MRVAVSDQTNTQIIFDTQSQPNFFVHTRLNPCVLGHHLQNPAGSQH